MKKTIGIIGVSTLIVLYLIYNSMFPLAEPIAYPEIGEINRYKVISVDDAGKTNIELKTEFEQVLDYIEQSKPTRMLSVNDRPSIQSYYEVSVETDDGLYTYYIYKEGSRTYVEVPYVGIYKVSSKGVDSLQ